MVVEHNLKSLFKIADRAYILDKGKVIEEGPAAEIVKTNIVEKYLLRV